MKFKEKIVRVYIYVRVSETKWIRNRDETNIIIHPSIIMDRNVSVAILIAVVVALTLLALLFVCRLCYLFFVKFGELLIRKRYDTKSYHRRREVVETSSPPRSDNKPLILLKAGNDETTTMMLTMNDNEDKNESTRQRDQQLQQQCSYYDIPRRSSSRTYEERRSEMTTTATYDVPKQFSQAYDVPKNIPYPLPQRQHDADSVVDLFARDSICSIVLKL